MKVAECEVPMDVLLTLALAAALFLVLEFFWCRPTWPHSPETRWDGEQLPGSPELLAAADPLALSFVRQRMDILALELELLDSEPPVFALAFRTHVAQAAYKALLAEAIELSEASRLTSARPQPGSTMVELELAHSGAPLREELEF
jgi:hypothetical protein